MPCVHVQPAALWLAALWLHVACARALYGESVKSEPARLHACRGSVAPAPDVRGTSGLQRLSLPTVWCVAVPESDLVVSLLPAMQNARWPYARDERWARAPQASTRRS